MLLSNNINMAISTGINDSDSDIATPAVNFTVSTDKMVSVIMYVLCNCVIFNCLILTK